MWQGSILCWWDILHYILSIMLYFIFHCLSLLVWEPWLYRIPTARTLWGFSNFEFLFQGEMGSRYLVWTLWHPCQWHERGFLVLSTSMWLVSRAPSWDLVSWFSGQVSFPLCHQKIETLHKRKTNRNGSWMVVEETDFFVFQRISGLPLILCGVENVINEWSSVNGNL